MQQSVPVYYEATPNPQAMKFLLGQQVASETVYFEDPLKAERSPLAKKLFGFPWMSAVMIGPDFITVTKQDWVGWDVLAEPLSDLIREHRDSGEPIVTAGPTGDVNDGISEADSPLVQNIKRVLNAEIRPAVAMDGGDVAFDRFEDGVLHLLLQGSCSGCPSSQITLKEGIETRMRELFPEIKEVR